MLCSASTSRKKGWGHCKQIALFIRLCYSLVWCLSLRWLTQIELCALTSAIIWLFIPSLIMFCIWILMLKLTPGFRTIQQKNQWLHTWIQIISEKTGSLGTWFLNHIQESKVLSPHTHCVKGRYDIVISPWSASSLALKCLLASLSWPAPNFPVPCPHCGLSLRYFSPHPSRLSSNVCLFISSELR